jgi:hypothetical protein
MRKPGLRTRAALTARGAKRSATWASSCFARDLRVGCPVWTGTGPYRSPVQLVQLQPGTSADWRQISGLHWNRSALEQVCTGTGLHRNRAALDLFGRPCSFRHLDRWSFFETNKITPNPKSGVPTVTMTVCARRFPVCTGPCRTPGSETGSETCVFGASEPVFRSGYPVSGTRFGRPWKIGTLRCSCWIRTLNHHICFL